MSLYIDHVNTVLSKLRETANSSLSTNADTEAYRAQIAVQRAVSRIFNARTWSFRQRRTTLSTVSGTSLYELPKTVGECYILKSSGATKTLDLLGEDDFDTFVPDPQESGDPRLATFFDMVGVSDQPSSASPISVVSSSAADTSQKVLIRGIVSGEETSEQISLNGTTSVSSTLSFSEIIAVTKSAVTTGRITLTSNAGAVTNVIMGQLEKTIRLRQVRLYPTPSSVLTITIKHFVLPPILTHVYDDTQIPHRWDYIIDQFAFALALQAKGQDQAAEFQTQITLAIKFLEEDMAKEERISSKIPVIPHKAGETDNFIPSWLPSGHGILST